MPEGSGKKTGSLRLPLIQHGAARRVARRFWRRRQAPDLNKTRTMIYGYNNPSKNILTDTRFAGGLWFRGPDLFEFSKNTLQLVWKHSTPRVGNYNLDSYLFWTPEPLGFTEGHTPHSDGALACILDCVTTISRPGPINGSARHIRAFADRFWTTVRIFFGSPTTVFGLSERSSLNLRPRRSASFL